MILGFKKFAGEFPAIAEFSLPREAATIARNCLLGSGSLRPLKDKAAIATLSKAPVIKTIFRHGDYWLHWREDVSVVRAPDAGDTTGRILFAFNDGSDSPKVTDLIYGVSGGGTGYPTNAYELGVPAPDDAPLCSLLGEEPDASESVDPRTYIVTFVNAWGHEGAASPISLNVNVGPNQSVELTNLGTAPVGNYNVTHKRIYRTSGGNGEAGFLFVDEIPVGQPTYEDTIDSDNLGGVWQTEDYDMPPSDLKGLVALPNGIVAGYSKNEVCFSLPGIYYAWPQKYRQPVDGEIVALGAFGSSLVILMKDGFPYMATGDHPENYVIARLEDGQACINPRGVVDIGYGVAYPGPDGLHVIGVEVNKNITENVIEPNDWKNLNPSGFVSGKYQWAYIAFYDNGDSQGTVLFAPKKGGLSYVDIHADSAFADRSTGDLFFCTGDTIYQWDAGAPLTYQWQSSPIDIIDPVNFGIMQVLAAKYPVDITVTMGAAGDSPYVFSETVTGREPFVCPSGYLEDRCQILVEGSTEVYRVVLAETIEEMQDNKEQ